MNEIYIEIGKDNIVTKVHRFPFDPKLGLQTPRAELEKMGHFVKSIPEPENIVGKRAVMKYNGDTDQVYYDYVTVPLSAEERVDSLENAFNELIMRGLSI